MTLRQSRHLLEFFVFRLVVCLVQMASPRLCARISWWLAYLFARVLPHRWTRYEVAYQNIRTSFGDQFNDAQIDQLIFRMWWHLFRLVAEIVQLPRRVRINNIVQTIEFRGKYQALRALCSGRPVMFVSGHYGNWELAVSVFGQFGFPMGLVARDLDNPYLNRWFFNFRKYTGHRPIPKKGGFDDITGLLARGGNLAILGDQDAGKAGTFIDFFGRPASTHKSIALLALEYNALICVGYARRLEHEFLDNGWPRYELGCEAVIDPQEYPGSNAVAQITQHFSTALELAIRRSPEQYFWIHRRWKTPPKRATRTAAPPPQRQAS